MSLAQWETFKVEFPFACLGKPGFAFQTLLLVKVEVTLRRHLIPFNCEFGTR